MWRIVFVLLLCWRCCGAVELDSEDTFREFLQHPPSSCGEKYVRALCEVGRYDLAVEYFEQQRDERGQRITDPGGYVAALFYANQGEKAKTIADQLLQKKLPLDIQLQIAKILYLMDDGVKIEPIISKVVDPSQRECESLVSLLLEMGEFDQIEAYIHQLGKSVSGVMLLTRYFVAVSQTDKALQLARRVHENFPQCRDAVHFIFSHETNPEALKTLVLQVQKEFNQNPTSWSWSQSHVEGLIALAQLSEDSIDKDPLFKEADLLLNRLLRQTVMLPQPFALQAQVQSLVGATAHSLESTTRALALEPSNLLAAQVAAQNAPILKAIPLLETASRFHPSNAEVWESLSRLNGEKGNWYDALNAAKKWTQCRPRDARAFVALGTFYQRVYNPEDASLALEQAHALLPGDVAILRQLLIVLHDPNLVLDAQDPDLLAQRQQRVAQAIRDLEP